MWYDRLQWLFKHANGGNNRNVSAVNEQYAFKEVRLKGKNKMRDLVRATVFFFKYSVIFQLFKENCRQTQSTVEVAAVSCQLILRLLTAFWNTGYKMFVVMVKLVT